MFWCFIVCITGYLSFTQVCSLNVDVKLKSEAQTIEHSDKKATQALFLDETC